LYNYTFPKARKKFKSLILKATDETVKIQQPVYRMISKINKKGIILTMEHET